MIRNVVFDMGGVLVDLRFRECFEAFLAHSTNPEETMRYLRPGDVLGDGGQTPLHDYELGNITTEEYLQSLLPALRPGTTTEEVADITMVALGDIPAPRRQAILNLRRKGYNVYLLSNINDLHWEACRERMEAPFPDAESGQLVAHPIGDYFHGLFLSQRLHLCKPDARIYAALIAQTGINPLETLYIDDVEVNVLAGRAAGLQAIQAVGDEWIPIVNELPAL